MPCIVCDSLQVNDCNLWLAFPVAAEREIDKFLNLQYSTIAFAVWVFPVPGPPVRINKELLANTLIASFCSSDRLNLLLLLNSSTNSFNSFFLYILLLIFKYLFLSHHYK